MTELAPDPELLPQEGEPTVLHSFLEYYRSVFLRKADGLTDAEARVTIPPSELSILGLVRHMAEVERGWFGRCIGGVSEADAPPIFYDAETNIDGDFDDVDPATVDADMATWRAEIARSDEMLAQVDLDDIRHHDRWDEDLDVRWVMVHMIEEYARHNGHADLLREAIDGITGD
jgi:hypothetical protein